MNKEGQTPETHRLLNRMSKSSRVSGAIIITQYSIYY